MLVLVSERDVVQALSRHSEAVDSILVMDTLTPNVASISTTDAIKRAMSLMTNGYLHHLLVVDNGALMGIVGLGDIVKYWLQEFELESNVLRDVYIAP